jgi:hypothetical protein
MFPRMIDYGPDGTGSAVAHIRRQRSLPKTTSSTLDAVRIAGIRCLGSVTIDNQIARPASDVREGTSMKAKLFDAHNKFLQDHEVPEASPTLDLKGKTFRLVDTDGSGALVYRESDDETTGAIDKAADRERLGE